MAKNFGSQRWTFSAVGLGVAAALSLGLLVVRTLAHSGLGSSLALGHELRREWPTYGYVLVSTMGVALSLGVYLGGRADRLQQLSLTDALTQLANRRAFLAVLQDEVLRAQRYHIPLALLILDIDHFKAVNDAHGHEAGDEALRQVADSLRTTCRATDFAARLGGDEFVVVMPSTAALEAVGLADRVRGRLVELSAKGPALGPLSVSLGIADLDAVVGAACPGEALVAAADTALYAAKDAGRDRVRLAVPRVRGQAVA